MNAIESPCSRICSIDPASGLCSGCGRTLAEIGAWTRLSAGERRAIMASLPGRIGGPGAPGGGPGPRSGGR